MATKNFLGYDKNENGEIIIDEEQAKIVREIYKMFIYGKSINKIAKELTEKGILAPSGGNRWHSGTVCSILKNEKYIGDALLQKTFVADYLTKKCVPNNGEVKQFYVKDNHPAIISREVYDMAQAELKRRSENNLSCNSPFSGRVICSECGGYFGRKVWHSTSQYRRSVWQCNEKYRSKKKHCESACHVDENKLKMAFVTAYNEIFDMKDEIVYTLETVVNEVFEETDYGKQLDAFELQLDALIKKNAREKLDQKVYLKEYNRLSRKQEKLIAKEEQQNYNREAFNNQKYKAVNFINHLKEQPDTLSEFNEQVWYESMKNITVIHKNKVTVNFLNGMSFDVFLD